MSELLFEIGCEELPPAAVRVGCEAMQSQAEAWRAELGESIDIQLFATPRRLTLSIKGLPNETARRHHERMGPALKAAFDAAGAPTRALSGFLQSIGIAAVSDLAALAAAGVTVKATDKGDYLCALLPSGGEKVADYLTAKLTTLLTTIPFAKSMRWGTQSVRFARPVQWLLAVLSDETGAQVLDVTLGDLKAGAWSRGHRFMAHDMPLQVATREEYVQQLAKLHVMAVPAARRESIQTQIRAAAQSVKGFVWADPSAGWPQEAAAEERYFSGLVEEVTSLCEAPFAVLGSIDARDVEILPKEVILIAMRGHQRYFAVGDLSQPERLLPYFITITATAVKNPAIVRSGNERVLRARLSDARYFYEKDLQRPLSERLQDLRQVTFHHKLGSLYDKVARVAALSHQLAAELAPQHGHALSSAADLALQEPLTALTHTAFASSFESDLIRAALLCKADLTTLMVGEFPELQGLMGGEYALKQGETAEVAQAIQSHYAPRGSEESAPVSDIAALISLADKLDTLLSLVAAGQGISGSSDPYGLRRAALGILKILLDKHMEVDLARLVLSHAERLTMTPPDKRAAAVTKVTDFIEERLFSAMQSLLPTAREEVVRAIAAASRFKAAHTQTPRTLMPLEIMRRLQAWLTFEESAACAPLLAMMKRILNMTKGQKGPLPALNPALLTQAVEVTLIENYQAAISHKEHDLTKHLTRIAALAPHVDAFFEGVMVMDPNESIKEARLALLGHISQAVMEVIDARQI